MNTLGQLNATSPGLLTDLYQLTMAYGYWRLGMQRSEAVFHLFFRRAPYGGRFAVAAGLATAVEYLQAWRFTADDTAYLATLHGADEWPLFSPEFLRFLEGLRFDCDVDAMPECTVAFANEPLLRVRGPLIAAQIVETALLNIVNFQTLVATKAARVVHAAAGDPVLEFGLRRAQGLDGGLSAARASYLGGCAATSNVLAGRVFGIPVKGTHAHSWVLCFEGEREAFGAYADALPGNCTFLVDTFDTLGGVQNAIAVARQLRERGHQMLGVRLDSGELGQLSVKARRMLDEAGFPEAAIVASNDLDEAAIADLKARGAAIGVWGVGTRLVTAHGEGALGGVYKLSAIRRGGGPWRFKAKRSDDPAKSSPPGVLQVRRFLRDGRAVGDMICSEDAPQDATVAIGTTNSEYTPPEGESCATASLEAVPPGGSHCLQASSGTPAQSWRVPDGAACEELLTPVLCGGRSVGVLPTLEESRQRLRRQFECFGDGLWQPAGVEDLYPVGWELGLWRQRTDMVESMRGRSE